MSLILVLVLVVLATYAIERFVKRPDNKRVLSFLLIMVLTIWAIHYFVGIWSR